MTQFVSACVNWASYQNAFQKHLRNWTVPGSKTELQWTVPGSKTVLSNCVMDRWRGGGFYGIFDLKVSVLISNTHIVKIFTSERHKREASQWMIFGLLLLPGNFIK